jgi:hypothetical protein
MIESGANKYIESSNIRVFPCAYRGYYEASGESKVFDPEARATTEANFANTYHKLSNKKDSYVVSWDEGNGTNTVLKCVIGGYYFEIYNQAKTDFFYLRQSDRTYQPYFLCIKTVSEELSNSTQDSVRTSSILASFERTDGTNNDRYLDVQKGSGYAFTGLTLLANPSAEVSAHLIPFIATGDEENVKYSLNPAEFPITAIIDTDTGKNSIRMLNIETGGTTASGDYAIALGHDTEAQALASVALCEETLAAGEAALAAGKNTKALGDYAFSAGKDTEAISEASVALGIGTKASSANQVVLGKYNYEDASQLFILADGTAARPSSANKFTVNYSGDVKALGTLETKGNITASGSNKTNSLNLGSTAEKSSGAINVYGEGPDKVFSVTKAGNTVIAGILDITNETQSTAVAGGAVRVHGGVGIKKTVNIGESLDVAGNTNLKGTLSVAANRDTNLGGKLSVGNDTTLNGNLTLTGTKAAIVGGELSVGGKATLNGDVEVAAGKTITLGSVVNISNELAATTSGAALSVAGGVDIKQNLIVESTTKSTSKETGALVVKGGAGIDGDMYVSGAIYSPKGVVVTSGGANITGTATFQDTNISGSTSIGGDTSVTKTTTSTSKDSGALVVAGGVGIGENLNVGGALNLAEDFTAEKAVTIKGITRIQDTSDSTGIASGALTVSGGAGISKKLYVGDNISGAKNLTLSGSNAGPNTITLGNNSSNNEGGQLLIYGTGISTVAEIDNVGDTYFAGNLEVDGEAIIGGKLAIDGSVEISKEGMAGLSSLTVEGKVEGYYFNATSYNTTSDRRKKCNIEDYKFTNSILNLPIKQFEYIEDVLHKKHIGCIAQDLQEICPEFVTETTDGTLMIQESKLIYALLQEVKELKEKVELLERS